MRNNISKRLQLLLCSMLMLLAVNSLFADNKYPLKLEIAQSHTGGILLFDSIANISYFIKPNWESSLDVITCWHGVEKSNSIGKPLGNYQIIDAKTVGRNLLILSHDLDKSYLQLFDSTLNLISIGQFPEDLTINPSSLKLKKENDSVLYILNNENLYKISILNNFFNIMKIVDKIADFEVVRKNNIDYLAVLENHNNSGILIILDKFLHEQVSARINIGSINEMQQVGSYLCIKSSFENSNSTLVNIFDLQSNKLLQSKYFESDINNIDFAMEKTNLEIFWISKNADQYLLNTTKYQKPENKFIYEQTKLPPQIYEPQKLISDGNEVFICFRNAILMVDTKSNIRLFDFIELGNKFGEIFSIQRFEKYIIISSKYYTEIYLVNNNPLWWLNRFASTLWIYIVPILLFFIAYIFMRLYLKERRLFKEFIDFPSIGAIFIINHKSELTIANQNAKDLLSLDPSIQFGKPFDSYRTADFADPIFAFYKHFDELKENLSQRISLQKPEGTFEYIFNISPEWSITGKYKGAIMIAFNITEEIERKRLSNWAQLAHDMQTNLAIIKLNAEQLKNVATSESTTQINRIFNQAIILQKRVRDIVTVGRSSNLEIVQTNSQELLNEVAMEFDESLFPDVEISISSDLFPIYCDKPKLIRALRNAIENGIKAMPNHKGKIELSAYQESRYTCIRIKDNGKGMDEEVRKKMLTPYFTTSKDGSGFGIGTLIIQEVVELHSGNLEINTQKNEGTELIVKIPTRLKKLSLN